ncbi:MAG: helix-turn-helix domain-containing protein [Rhodobacteraceae bacterium]|nr:helix-turn-helix domain-containing protein [Paracoccaceae bacterium]
MFSIGEMARRTGVRIPTIRYYEGMGLISPPERSSGNQRRYDWAALARLSFIRHARDLGLSIQAIRDLAELSSHPERSCAEAHAIAAAHHADIKRRIASLRRLERELARIRDMDDDGHVGECRVIEALSDHKLCIGGH